MPQRSSNARISAQEIHQIEQALRDAETAEEVMNVLQTYFDERYGVTEEHLNFLKEQGGIAKLRNFFWEVIDFDLQHGTYTCSFISEEKYQERAKSHPHSFAIPSTAKHGVKHRSSLTSSITDAFRKSFDTLNLAGIDPAEATVTDLGCGEGKAVLIAGQAFAFQTDNNEGIGEDKKTDYYSTNANPVIGLERYKFAFRKAVGVDYYKEVLEIARRNAEIMKLDPTRVSFEFANAAQYRRFNGINVVYMYNPFDAEIMKAVEYNMRQYGGRTVLAYNKPVQIEVFDSKHWQQRHLTMSGNDPDKHTVILTHNIK